MKKIQIPWINVKEGSELHAFYEVHRSVIRRPPVLPATPVIRSTVRLWTKLPPWWTKVPPWSDLVESTGSNRVRTEGFLWQITIATSGHSELTTCSRDSHASSNSEVLGQVIPSDRKKPHQLWDILMSRIAETKHQRCEHQVFMSLATRI